MRWKEIKDAGGLAVVTGGARGIGFAAARHLAQSGFDLLLADVHADALSQAAQALQQEGASVTVRQTDVSRADDVDDLARVAFETGDVAVLMNNAGIGISSSTWADPAAWRKTLDVNFYGVLNGVQSFVPRLLERGKPAVIINTGSKQGITTPPGNPAYNVSKAAVKVLTEQLAHEARQAEAALDVHLFVPGFTHTPMTSADMSEKHPGAWTSEQTVSYLFDRVARGDFYILCPDNMANESIDARRITWNANDIVENRPPLSRWHAGWAEKFKDYEQS